MKLKQKEIQKSLISLNLKLWLFLVVYQDLKESRECSGLDFESSNEAVSSVSKLSESFDKSPFQDEFSGMDEDSSEEKSQFCHYFKSTKRLVCTGSIDFGYLKAVRKENITDFIVQKYEAESVYKRKYWSDNTLKTGEWYIKLPKTYQKLTGEIILKDTGIQMSVILRLIPHKDLSGFFLEGEAFSNKVIKISWRLKGNLSLDFVKNRTVVGVTVKADTESDWKLQSNLTFNQRNVNAGVDEWKALGVIQSNYLSRNEYVLFKGVIGTRVMKGECRFSGEINLHDVSLVGVFAGTVAPPYNKQITIPEAAFSEMIVKNLVFKDSVFFNDFDKNSFKGLNGVETVAFIGTKMEGMPKLDGFFQSFTDLKEIYIEDCTTPLLKFGTVSNLKNVQKLSFKGSGPLNFDDLSFAWLKDSNLTFLNLQNSHAKIFLKGKSLFWSVKNSLKYLDISYSTLTQEKDLISILADSKIVHLMAEGLELRKIPTNAFLSIGESLEYLSLRNNDFKKILEKHMFDIIFNFPYMPKLKELNLMECHINYIEKGAFDNLPNLKILHLAYNHFENLQDGWTFMKPAVSILDLSYNGLTPQTPTLGLYDMRSSMNLSAFESLEVLNLSNGIFTNVSKLILSLRSNLKNLSLRNTGLENLPEGIFKIFTKLEILDISYNQNLKNIHPFSFNLFKNLISLRNLDIKFCRISNSEIFRIDFNENNVTDEDILESLEYLDLSGNNLKVIDSETLKMFPKLKVLNLSGNNIAVWKTSLFSFHKYLETVFLDENKIETITSEMLSDVKKLKNVKLGNNPFICGPFVYEIVKIAFETPKTLSPNAYFNSLLTGNKSMKFDLPWKPRLNPFNIRIQNFPQNEEHVRNTRNMVNILDWSENSYMCFSWFQGRFLPFTWLNETYDDLSDKKIKIKKIPIIWLPFVAVIGIVITVAIICWKCLDVHLITRAVRNAVALSFLARGEKEVAKYEYNVFVSYSDKDRLWVVEKLLPQLESWKDVKVCLHERDFQVGLSILENIISSIDKSKNIILVLSQSFLKSQWCQYEMHLAQHRLLEKGRDQLILIFLENIPAMKRTKTLKYLMMTKTYIEWPVNSKNQKDIESFWNRLMKSLLKFN